MKHDADPYAKKRALWRSMRRMAALILFQARMLAWLGLLSKRTAASRWLAHRLSALEHGLRCLLVIALPAGKNDPLQIDRHGDQAEQSIPRPPAWPGARRRKPFSLSLKALGFSSDQAPVPDRHQGGKTPQTDAPLADQALLETFGVRPSPLADVQDRLAAIASVLNDTAAQVDRMRRHVARLGLVVRRRCSVRPSDDRARPRASSAMPRPPGSAVPFIDTS